MVDHRLRSPKPAQHVGHPAKLAPGARVDDDMRLARPPDVALAIGRGSADESDGLGRDDEASARLDAFLAPWTDGRPPTTADAVLADSP